MNSLTASNKDAVSAPATSEIFLLCAVEPSGDALGADLMEELRAIYPGAVFYGCGGSRMADQGLNALFPIDRFSVFGPIEALGVIRDALRRARELGEFAAQYAPRAVILIDSWGFNYQVARRVRRMAPSVPIVKYVAPQVWASRPKRIEKLKATSDLLLSILPFETELFRGAGIATTYVGNSTFEAAYGHSGDGSFRRKYGIPDEATLLLLLPGSRAGEIKTLLPVYHQTLLKLRALGLEPTLALLAAPSVAERIRREVADWPFDIRLVEDPDDKQGAFAAADVALAASGTITSELAINDTPMAVVYKVGWFVGLYARLVVLTKYVSIINIVLGREVVPEFLQDRCRPDLVAAALEHLLRDKDAVGLQKDGFDEFRRSLGLGGEPPARKATRAIEALLSGAAASETISTQTN